MLDAVTIQQCAPMVNHHLMMSVVSVESSHNPYAIGVVNGRLQRQPKSLYEAQVTAQFLERTGYNYSVGAAQVNRINFNRFNLDLNNVFDPCTNLNAGGQILRECLDRAIARGYQQNATNKALSCYYTGQLNSKAGTEYANKVIAKLIVYLNQAQNRAVSNSLQVSNTKASSNGFALTMEAKAASTKNSAVVF
jgi:type IV secretion system protein VirB1